MQELTVQGMRDGDLEAVRMMCLAAWRHRQAGEQIERFGVLVQGPRGPIVNPMLRVERDSAALYARLADQFGLTLSSRLRLGLIQLAGQSILKSLNDDLDVG
jgi:P27 family predicted phage terminase small subunit